MVSSIGYKLNNLTPITGFGYKRHYLHTRQPSMVGHGVVRTLASKAVRHAGHAIVDRVANAIAGGSYKITGVGAHKKRKPKAKTGGAAHRIRKPRKNLTIKRHHRLILI